MIPKRKRGRPPVLDTCQVKEHFALSESAPKTAKHFNVSTAAIHYHLKKV